MEQRRVQVGDAGRDLHAALIAVDLRCDVDAVAQIVEEREAVAAAVADERADLPGQVVIDAAGPRPGIAAIADRAEGAVQLRIAIVVERQRIAVRTRRRDRRCKVFERAVDRVMLPPDAAVDPQLVGNLQFVDRIARDVLAGVARVDLERRSAREAVPRDDPAIRECQIQSAGVWLGGEQHAVAEIPSVTRLVPRVVDAAGQRVAARFPLEREIVDEGLDVLLDAPEAGLDDRLVGRGRRTAGREGERPDRPAPAGGIGGGGDRRGAAGDETDRVRIALHPAAAIANRDPAAEFVIEIAAQIVDLRAAAIRQIDPAAVVAHADPRVAPNERSGACIKAGIFADLVAVLDDRDGQQPLAAIVEIATEEQDRALVEVMADIAGDLTTALRLELRVADPARGRVIAAEHIGCAVVDRPRDVAVDAELAEIGAAEFQQSGRRLLALALDEVDGQAGLTVREQRAGAAAHRFDALDRLVDTDQLRVFEERQRRRREEGHALRLEGDIFRIATRRIAAHEDVGAGLAARTFGADPRHRTKDFGGAGSAEPLRHAAVDRGDRERGVLAPGACARGADDDDIGGGFLGHLRRGGISGRLCRGDLNRRWRGFGRLSMRVDDQIGPARRQPVAEPGAFQDRRQRSADVHPAGHRARGLAADEGGGEQDLPAALAREGEQRGAHVLPRDADADSGLRGDADRDPACAQRQCGQHHAAYQHGPACGCHATLPVRAIPLPGSI